MYNLLKLSVGASDYLRWLGLGLLVAAAGLTGKYGEGEKFRNLSDKLHAEIIDLQHWVEPL
jgi:hypothetical protein